MPDSRTSRHGLVRCLTTRDCSTLVSRSPVRAVQHRGTVSGCTPRAHRCLRLPYPIYLSTARRPRGRSHATGTGHSRRAVAKPSGVGPAVQGAVTFQQWGGGAQRRSLSRHLPIALPNDEAHPTTGSDPRRNDESVCAPNCAGRSAENTRRDGARHANSPTPTGASACSDLHCAAGIRPQESSPVAQQARPGRSRR